VPDELRRPEVTPGGESLLNAFWVLSSDRPLGQVIGHIPFTAIDRYAVRFGFDTPTDFALLLKVIRALDHKFLDIARMKQEQVQATAKQRAKRA
jgi:hypothetical protein